METVYIETTIVSYLVARPSRDLVLAAHQELTREWWQTQRPNFHCIASEEVRREASDGEPVMSRARLSILDELPMIEITPGVVERAVTFIDTGALPRHLLPDAIHLAAATQAEADYLLTWNCRHLANAHILRRLALEALRRGWRLPIVCTPLELMGDSQS